MKKTDDVRGRRTPAVLLAVALVAALTVPLNASAMDASVVVSFDVRPSIGASLTGDEITVRSGAAWVLTTTSAQSGAATTTAVVEGIATGREGTTVPVAGLVGYSLVSDR